LPSQCDTIWRSARLATMAGAGLGLVEQGLIACKDGTILYAGIEDDAPSLEAKRTIDCEGRWITPGLIDSHTHLVHAGNRAHEFELRLAGASYEEIARAGGFSPPSWPPARRARRSWRQARCPGSMRCSPKG
jgi:imidazolonepropionase